MTATLVRPKANPKTETEIYPKQKLWTKEQCHQMVERGELDERYELIEGIIYEHMPKHRPHVITVMLVFRWLASIFGGDFVQKEDPIEVPGEAGRFNEPEPDIVVTKEPFLFYAAISPGPEDMILAVEVSDSTVSFDRRVKAKVYARAGIAEYWVMDVKKRCIYRYRLPKGEAYKETITFSENETISAPGRSETALVGELFAPVVEAK